MQHRLPGKRIGGLADGGEDAAAVDAQVIALLHQPELHREPVEPRQIDPILLAGVQPELAIEVGEVGEGGVGQHGAVAEDLVEDVGLLQVVELVPAADEGGHRKLAISEQGKEAIEGDERGHGGHRPAGGGGQGGVDLPQLRDAIPRQCEPSQPRPVCVAGLALERRELARDQDLPGPLLFLRVVDDALLVRLVCCVATCHDPCHLLPLEAPCRCSSGSL